MKWVFSFTRLRRVLSAFHNFLFPQVHNALTFSVDVRIFTVSVYLYCLRFYIRAFSHFPSPLSIANKNHIILWSDEDSEEWVKGEV